ncbi:MAG: hypothetical protein KC519_16865, partial [Anaerolineae bacterium]|nr:hypothetical protein [Anaerolineae bacterium]
RLTINGLEINLNNNNPAINETTRAINGYFTTQIGNGVVQSVAVSEDRLQITWLGDDPNGGAVTIQDSLLSLTFSEASVNRMSWVTNPTGPNVSAIQVDLQPGQAVVDVSRTIEPTLVRYILVPTVVNGIVTWRIDAGVGFESGLAGSIASLWNAYFDGIYREGTLSNTVITDDAVTFTWDLNRADPSGNPIVTYHTTEAEINAALAHYTPPELSALTVDMQPGRVIINAVGSNSQWGDFTVSMSMVPMLANGDLTWQAESVTINDLSSDLSDFQPADVVTDMLAQGTNNLQRGYVMDFTLDGTSMSITVRY